MSLAWRVTATLLAVATFAALVVNRFVLTPLLWHIESTPLRLCVGLGAYVLAAAGPALGYLWLTRRLLPRRPATVRQPVDGSAFVVPASPLGTGSMAIMLMMLAGQAVPYEGVADTDRIVLPSDPAFFAPFIILTGLLVALALAGIWLPGPSVRLTPAGITARQGVRSRTIAWDDLLPGGPHPARRMRLLYRDGDGPPKRCTVRTSGLHVDPAFLATVIRHYAEHPEHRAAIGTLAELNRLESGFTAWRPTPAPVPQPA